MASLRFRLVGWLLPPLVVVGVVAAGGAYAFLERRLTDAYDLDLGDIARALVPYVRMREQKLSLEITELADAVLRADSTDQIFYTVRDAKNHVVAGDPDLTVPPDFAAADNTAYFWYGERRGVPIRAVALRNSVSGEAVTVIAAETLRKRETMLSAIVPVALLSVAGVIAILLGVRRGLGPIDDVRNELQGRTPADLRALAESEVPDELQPLVHELNGMLARVEGLRDLSLTTNGYLL